LEKSPNYKHHKTEAKINTPGKGFFFQIYDAAKVAIIQMMI
jgi:hypothetical protein